MKPNEIYEKYYLSIRCLEKICPKSKLEDLKKII